MGIAITIVTGMVSIQDKAISFNTSHLTLDSRSPAPTPMIDILTTCVVLTGPPSKEETMITTEDANCDVKL